MARTIDFAKKLRKIAASLEELATALESFQLEMEIQHLPELADLRWKPSR